MNQSSSKPVDISVIVVNYRSGLLLKKCLEHLFAARFPGQMEITVVNNSPGDGCQAMLDQYFPEVRLIAPGRNLGFGPACNLAFADVRGEFVLLLNPDAFIPENALEISVDYLRQYPKVAVAGAQLTTESGEWQPSARCFQSVFDKFFVLSGLSARFPKSKLFGRVDMTWWDHGEPRAVDWVVGAFFMIRTEMGRALDWFDERFFLYFEELDLCRRAIAEGWEVHYLPDVIVPHVGGACSAEMDPATVSGAQITLFRLFAEALYYAKHHGRIGALSMLGLEIWWCRLRWLRNRLKRGVEAERKAQALARHVAMIKLALSETNYGTHIPAMPWNPDPKAYKESFP
ncbi:MAG: glycosyltransferase family 2 protein [Acidobacteriota bacterium]|nr:glycosyltransferase family 2 protein [Acidobacteriota bacterium]